MPNPILVTGATGNIGRELVKQLKAAGAHVIAGSPSGESVARLVETRHVDFVDPASLKRAFQGIDTLFLLFPLQANMVELARNAVAAAKAAGVKHIVRSSGAGADASSPVAIARVQGEIDQLVIDSGIAYTLLRPNSFMQNFLNFYAGMIRGGALYLPQGQGKVSFVDTRDIAAVAAAVLQQPADHAGKVYTLTGGEALSNADVAACIGAALGRTISYVPMRQAGMTAWSIETLMSLNRIIAAGYTAEVSPDVQRVLGRAPIRFDRFVADNLAAWR
jgi:uncharacterized protein YbjT (DUF2867 family)